MRLNKIYILSFTNKGYDLAKNIEKCFDDYDVTTYRVKNLRETVKDIFKQGNTIIFIGAIGIAVRGISSFIEHKTKDPAVIVIDEKGEYIIPILSGHIGGANEISLLLADFLKATPIITTATDINNVFSIDVFSKKNNYYIKNPEKIKTIATNLLEQKDVTVFSEYEIATNLPQNFVISENMNLDEVRVYFGAKYNDNFDNTLVLMPKIYHIGIGCKKDTKSEALESFFIEKLVEYNIDMNLINTISSIDLKKNEKALIDLSKKYNIPFITYTKDELLKYEDLFEKSDFVKNITGVSSVCETSAYTSSNCGEVIVNKCCKNGMTLAIAIENWTVRF